MSRENSPPMTGAVGLAWQPAPFDGTDQLAIRNSAFGFSLGACEPKVFRSGRQRCGSGLVPTMVLSEALSLVLFAVVRGGIACHRRRAPGGENLA